eukprot:TRINITY_DN28955_c0_g1_i4.p2 TRINITY_DN28955_c0_g1~~TRINITY_DN28955_c0_g1_i4.p2  ORF type:complete len:117 (+),score=24.91 TRINITY_DN28955_c0_g1_i4:1-351(+)
MLQLVQQALLAPLLFFPLHAAVEMEWAGRLLPQLFSQVLPAHPGKLHLQLDLLQAFRQALHLPSVPMYLSLIHISEPTRPLYISYAVFCLKKKKKKTNEQINKKHKQLTNTKMIRN